MSKMNTDLHDYELYRRRIRAAREALGLSQEDMAAKFGISKAAFGQWENDIDNVKLGNVKRLCTILHIPIEELCSPNVCKEEASADIKKLAVLFRMMMQSINEEVNQ
ncbi:MAG: helix-turn-helix transcriptional regulator [Ruminococcus sp.]|nr:helix-turn-helix transcriptional regulator [Ruminococcus sp.]